MRLPPPVVYFLQSPLPAITFILLDYLPRYSNRFSFCLALPSDISLRFILPLVSTLVPYIFPTRQPAKVSIIVTRRALFPVQLPRGIQVRLILRLIIAVW